MGIFTDIPYYAYITVPILLLKFNKKYFEVNSTNCLKGFLAIGIVFHHISQLAYAGTEFKNFQNMGQILVGLFFILSGYGLYYQYERKEDYLKGFLSKRIIKIGIPTIIVSMIYVIYRILFLKETIIEMSMGNFQGRPFIFNGWFIYVIILFYIFFYLSFKYIRNHIAAILLLFLLVNSYIILLEKIGFGVWWRNSALAFILGIIFAKYKERIETFLSKKRFILFYIFIMLPMVYILNKYDKIYEILNINSCYIYDILANVGCCTMGILILVLISRLDFGNADILKFIGSISLEIYMIHGLFINLYTKISNNVNNIIVIGFVFIFTIPAAYIIKKSCDKVYILLRRKNVSINCN